MKIAINITVKKYVMKYVKGSYFKLFKDLSVVLYDKILLASLTDLLNSTSITNSNGRNYRKIKDEKVDLSKMILI